MAETRRGARGPKLGEAAVAEVHRIQWDAAEVCYRWLTEWEDAEVEDASELERLHRHLRLMSDAVHSAAAELERIRQEPVAA